MNERQSISNHLHEMAEHPARRTAENLLILDRVASTNLIARSLARECLNESSWVAPCLVVAYEQTAGRGRRGNRWLSPAGRGVYATWVAPLTALAGALEPGEATTARPEAAPGAAARVLGTLPLLAGIGLCRGVDRCLHGTPLGGVEEPLVCGLKWPNDLQLGGHKLGGILVELVTNPNAAPGAPPAAALIGFGINYRQPPAPATSLLDHLPAGASPPSLAAFTWALALALSHELRHLGDETYAAREYGARSVHRPGDTLRCRLPDEEVEGVFRGFDARGFLRLEVAAGGGGTHERRLSAGEIIPASDAILASSRKKEEASLW